MLIGKYGKCLTYYIRYTGVFLRIRDIRKAIEQKQVQGTIEAMSYLVTRAVNRLPKQGEQNICLSDVEGGRKAAIRIQGEV